ncbi:hypothetical protein CHL76_12150 [Marinococcus halophilus]|uniref:Uncharacterized protein n=1 Tax=Marinococcus halophilus TaxID=1371 RepID=A0A510Y7P9_MARHA|nr:hypothetical protein [Marinococcus halophilus]OZT79657.1 hypothetical protein CHL76_12150 [Marinococcus halophilus]GEK59400.1 hypothetical protein MHA01_23050 [Marinococcus halophilus]
MTSKNSSNGDLTNEEFHNKTRKRNPTEEIENPFEEADKQNENTSTSARNVKITSDKEPIEKAETFNKNQNKYVTVNCTRRDRDRLKAIAVMNDTTMIHLTEMGVSHLVHKEDLSIKNNIEENDRHTTIRVYPDDRSLLKKLSFKHTTTMANVISNMIDYLEERYDY